MDGGGGCGIYRVPELQLREMPLLPIYPPAILYGGAGANPPQGPGAPAPGDYPMPHTSHYKQNISAELELRHPGSRSSSSGGLPYAPYLTLQAEHCGGAGAPPPQKKAPTPSGAGAAISYTSNSRFTPVEFLPSPARPVAPGGRRPRRRRRQGRSGYPAGSRSAASAWKAAAGRVS